MQVATISANDGEPATSIVVTVVSSSSDWTFGFVSASRSRATWRAPDAGSAAAVVAGEGDASMRAASLSAPANAHLVAAGHALRLDRRGSGGGRRVARLGEDLAPDVLHRLDRPDARDQVEVVDGRRRRGEPLERVGLPRVRAGDR